MNPTWILIANAAQARRFEQQPGRPLVQLQAFGHPASRLRSLAEMDRRVRHELIEAS